MHHWKRLSKTGSVASVISLSPSWMLQLYLMIYSGSVDLSLSDHVHVDHRLDVILIIVMSFKMIYNVDSLL